MSSNICVDFGKYLQLPEIYQTIKKTPYNVVYPPARFCSLKIFRGAYRASQLVVSTANLAQLILEKGFDTRSSTILSILPFAKEFKSAMSMSRIADCIVDWDRDFVNARCLKSDGSFNEAQYRQLQQNGSLYLRRFTTACGTLGRTCEFISYFNLQNTPQVAAIVNLLAQQELFAPIISFGLLRTGLVFTVLFYGVSAATEMKELGLTHSLKNRATLEKIGKTCIFLFGGALIPEWSYREKSSFVLLNFAVDLSANYGFFYKDFSNFRRQATSIST
jgi:hypothetical protein